MATPPSSSSSSGIIGSPSLPPHRLHHFTPIHEGNESEEDDSERDRQSSVTSTPTHHVHQPTPLHTSTTTTSTGGEKRSSRKRRVVQENTTSISCNNCRPSGTREYKTTSLQVVPVIDGSSNNRPHHTITIPSPNEILKSILSTLALRSPKQPPPRLSSESVVTTPSPASVTKRKEERWKLAAAELSQKLIQANRKRDDAILEASKLKNSMSQLEKKLNKLEVYCHSLKSGIEGCSNSTAVTTTSEGNNNNNNKPLDQRAIIFSPFNHFATDSHDQIIENFLTAVSESRSAVRHLSRAMTAQIRQTGVVKFHDRFSSSSSSIDLKLTSSKNPRTTILYLESLLHQTLFTDFESPNFSRTAIARILNPVDRCETAYTSYTALRSLTWEEVLAKGTKHFSEEFSGYCDRKMSEVVVGLLGWKDKAWPEPLLQAFFGACKSVWLVHLLANSVHPSLVVFRVENGCGFDPVYMDDLGREKVAGSGLVPSVVRVMVAPGFYVGDSVVKCKVLCRYASGRGSVDGFSCGDGGRILLGCEKSSTP